MKYKEIPLQMLAVFFLVTYFTIYSYIIMKVVNPNNTTHTIQIVPRYYDFDTTVLTLTSLGEPETVTHTATTTNGITEIEFDFIFTERDKYEIKLTEGSEIIYRGQLFATEQEPQDFNITVNYISYE